MAHSEHSHDALDSHEAVGHEGEHKPDLHEAIEHTSKKARIALGRLESQELTATQSIRELGKSFADMAMAIVDLGKDTASHFKNTGKEIISTPGVIGKVAFSLASFVKIPLETSVSIVEMFVKQGMSIGDTIASLTAWKKVPAPVANTIRAVPAAIGWLLSPLHSQKYEKEAHATHH